MYCGFGDKFVEQQAHLIGISALVSKAEPPGTLAFSWKAIRLRRQRHLARSNMHELVQFRRCHASFDKTELTPVFHVACSIKQPCHRGAIK